MSCSASLIIRTVFMLAILSNLGSVVRLHSFSTVAAESRVYRTLQVQVVHRHGDRSPITPLKDEAFWARTLIPEPLAEKIAQGTVVIRGDIENTHKAGGRGPFGKLTELGLLQMIQVGNILREQYVSNQEDEQAAAVTDENGNIVFPYLWTRHRPLSRDQVRVISTDFTRTIQSVQGLLVGLFPDANDLMSASARIPIDVRHTNWMIPDPQPRRTHEQEILERKMSADPTTLAREQELWPLALRVTTALHDYLASDAHEVSFGVEKDEEHQQPEQSIEIKPLGWSQLAELTKCLSVRNLLPDTITQEDVETIAKHTASQWFRTFSHPRLAFLSMNKMACQQVDYLANYKNEPLMTIWSAHDSTLIGLLCAYRLERPAVWPEYASYLLLELIQTSTPTDQGSKAQLFVRFSLNGEVLKSHWEGEEPMEMIPLELLQEKIRTVGATPMEIKKLRSRSR